MESGVARRPITDREAYTDRLRRIMGYDNRIMRRISDEAKKHPKKVVFGEANTDNMLQAAVQELARNSSSPYFSATTR